MNYKIFILPFSLLVLSGTLPSLIELLLNQPTTGLVFMLGGLWVALQVLTQLVQIQTRLHLH